MAPFCLYMYGDAGVGKTVLMSKIINAIASHRVYDSKNGIYDWIQGANFQNLSNHWCVRMDDPCHGIAADAPNVRNEVQEVVALVNNALYPVEQAAVEMKGRVFAAPALLTITSNFVICE